MVKRILVIILFVNFFIARTVAQQPSLNSLNPVIQPVDSSGNYLPYLASGLKGNVICGLGEASHGTHEFSTEKKRIINYLIANENYRSIGFEFGYSSIAPINNYVLTGKGNLRQLMKPLRLFRTSEMFDLFQSIKAYNDKQAVANKVSLFGFDTDYFKSDIDASAVYCYNYLSRHPEAYNNGRAGKRVLKKIAAPNFGNMFDLSGREQTTIAGLNNEVSNQQSGPVGFARFKKSLSLLYQGMRLADPLARDKFMAANIIEIQQANNLKTIIWGHNVHLAKDTTMAQCKGMGYYLRQNYQSRYYAIGFDTFKGSVTVMDGDTFIRHDFETPQPSFSALFAGASAQAFYISFDGDSPTRGSTGNITNIFANWSKTRALPMRPGIDFNAILFIRNTTSSAPLN